MTKNTLFLSLVCTIGQVGIALIIAFLMTLRRLRFKAFHRAVIFFPVVMSALVVGYVWRFIYNSNYGLLNMFLNFIGKPEWIRLWLDDQSIVLRSVSSPGCMAVYRIVYGDSDECHFCNSTGYS